MGTSIGGSSGGVWKTRPILNVAVGEVNGDGRVDLSGDVGGRPIVLYDLSGLGLLPTHLRANGIPLGSIKLMRIFCPPGSNLLPYIERIGRGLGALRPFFARGGAVMFCGNNLNVNPRAGDDTLTLTTAGPSKFQLSRFNGDGGGDIVTLTTPGQSKFQLSRFNGDAGDDTLTLTKTGTGTLQHGWIFKWDGPDRDASKNFHPGGGTSPAFLMSLLVPAVRKS